MGRPSKYTPEFRRETLAFVRSSGRQVAEVARSLGINDNTLGNWVKAEQEAGERSADPRGLSESERGETKGRCQATSWASGASVERGPAPRGGFRGTWPESCVTPHRRTTCNNEKKASYREGDDRTRTGE